VWSTPFVSTITEVTRTRGEAAAHLRAEQVPEARVADAMLLLSELVTNAVHHGTEPLEVRIDTFDDRLRVEVDDANADPPVLRPVDPRRLGGMGIRIVDEVSDAWGTSRTPSGKTVWFELALP
jgi:anti-sigma regulatory factor (Ser/Thr protein kinase)